MCIYTHTLIYMYMYICILYNLLNTILKWVFKFKNELIERKILSRDDNVYLYLHILLEQSVCA